MIVAKTYEKELRIAEVVLDKAVQMRAALNRIAIADYAEAMETGEEFPPIDVYTKPGDKKWVADGFHRVLAARKLKRKTIAARIHHGGKREAILHAAGANVKHGVRRTNEDKRRAVLALLGDREWKEWADTAIAVAANVSTNMVARYRGYLGNEARASGDEFGETRRFRDRAGNERKITVPIRQDTTMDEKLSGGRCPYCGQKMPGQQHRIR